MIRVTITYPSAEDSTFDHDYYRNSHVPLVVRAWSPITTSIEKGVQGPSVAAVHMTFDSVEAFHAGLGSPLMGEVMADTAVYTNIAPVMQISEIVE